jgi:hypothetical protein
MNIILNSLLEDDIENEFRKGNIVFKITAHTTDGDTREIGMVNTKEDYERKLYTHKYLPVLFLVELPLRLAYLYGCLNVVFRRSRNEEYVFWWRKIGENRWEKWFTVKRYNDSIYGEPPEFIT